MKLDGLIPAGTSTLAEGLLVRYKGRDAGPPLRITQVFKASVYAMAYTTPSGARNARKPHHLSRRDVEADLKAGKAGLFKIELPGELHRTHPTPNSSEDPRSRHREVPEQTIDVVSGWIAPLVRKFDVESNLERVQFKALIQKRADELGMSFTTLRRMLLRFYYFGRVPAGLAPLVSGPDPGTGTTRGTKAKSLPRRRGRQEVLTARLGKNTFVVDEADVDDMIKAVKRCARKKSDLVYAHDEYMKSEFAKRHPEAYEDYINKRCVLPVTERQFSMYAKAHAAYEKEVSNNIPALAANDPGTSVHASGPGEISEIDATGGRVDIVGKDASGEPVLLYRPWIYLMIDRWSRFIMSVYVTLGAPSWEELKYVLLLAFTPRIARFRCLGIEVDEIRWPRGRIPFAIAHDRGSDFQSIANLKASVEQLRIESLTMPPLTPNARLIERAIRELKRNMARSGLSGVFAERPIDPKSKRTAKTARRAAASCLRDVYRCVLKVVDAENNKPHTALKDNLQLIQAGVPPIPVKAYLWGSEHITGARVSSLSEKDLMRMLLSVGRGSIAKSRLKFEKRMYQPVDREALALASNSTARPRGVEVRYDKTFWDEIYVVTTTGQWSLWRMVDADRQQTKGVLKEEVEALDKQGALLWATAKNDSKIERVSARPTRTAPARHPARHGSREETQARRRSQTREMKESLTGRETAELESPHPSRGKSSKPSWRDLEKAERLKIIARTSSRRAS
ncbi:hypothetical protein QTI17_13930 [Variovorax sp. J31P179]|uniref:hypothetical protein n=1 Tax=Variovorax sp. J31P179 TaxID=3053508 RepID=UPI002574F5DA|nr:hypothetical protein [Variovorax sp. J31P179]MDM0081692.1 hypothetical protein [Variovorax sp. J31P179]